MQIGREEHAKQDPGAEPKPRQRSRVDATLLRLGQEDVRSDEERVLDGREQLPFVGKLRGCKERPGEKTIHLRFEAEQRLKQRAESNEELHVSTSDRALAVEHEGNDTGERRTSERVGALVERGLHRLPRERGSTEMQQWREEERGKRE